MLVDVTLKSIGISVTEADKDLINTLRLRENGCNFPDNFLEHNFCL